MASTETDLPQLESRDELAGSAGTPQDERPRQKAVTIGAVCKALHIEAIARGHLSSPFAACARGPAMPSPASQGRSRWAHDHLTFPIP